MKVCIYDVDSIKIMSIGAEIGLGVADAIITISFLFPI
jgi:hypothetical protein